MGARISGVRPSLSREETNMAVACVMTCKIGLIRRHMKTIYGAPSPPLPTGTLKQSYATDFLRVRAFFHKTVWVCQVNCNFKISFTCRITVIFGTLKNGSLLINTLASNICFSYRNMFQNCVDALSKIVDAFLSKSSKFYLVWIIR